MPVVVVKLWSFVEMSATHPLLICGGCWEKKVSRNK